MTVNFNLLAHRKYLFPLLLLLVVIFAACTGAQQDAGDPASAVEDYLSVMVANETDKIPQLVCPAYEGGARTEFDSFGAVGGARLEGVECSGEASGDSANVTCTGAISFTYNGENQSLDLTGSTYSAQRVDGEWKMCGYVTP